jgi:hypothetical protein
MRPSGNHILKYKRVKRRWNAPWTPSELQLLGQRTDAGLAQRLGRSIKEVAAMRESRHIKAATPNRRWTEEENRMLGTMPDVELARRLKRGITGVEQQRLKLGISFHLSGAELVRLLGHQGQKVNAYRQQAKRLHAANSYQKWEDAFLGKMTDGEAARKTGRTISSIHSRRTRLGIPAVYVHPEAIRPWTAEEIKLLGTMTDSKLARQLGRKKHQVLAKRLALKIPPFQHRCPSRLWKASEIKLLGRFIDSAVARKIGCPQYTARKKRLKLGIPACRPGPKYRKWTQAEDRLLGTMPDPKAGRQLKRSRGGVLARRKRQQIPAWSARQTIARIGNQIICPPSKETKSSEARHGN